MTNAQTQLAADRDAAGAPLADAALRASFDYCRRIARARARNFFYGMKLTPQPKRAAMYVVYAFMRACDDLADDAAPPPHSAGAQPHASPDAAAAHIRRIERFREQMDRLIADRANGRLDAALHPMAPAFRHVMRTYAINPDHLHAMLDGQLDDLRRTRYATFDDRARQSTQAPVQAQALPGLGPAAQESPSHPSQAQAQALPGLGPAARESPAHPSQAPEGLGLSHSEAPARLYDYCYKVASTVGLVCVSVWGYEGGDATLTLAEQRGVALQLTNILRDVVEDAKRGRVYLPDDELAAHDFDHDSFIDTVCRGEADDRFDRLMTFQLDRARQYYEASSTLERFLPADCRPTCWAIMAVYRRLLEKIAAHPRRVLHERVRLRRAQKVAVVLRARLGGRPWESDRG